MLRVSVAILILFNYLLGWCYGAGYYTIVASENIRPNSDYQISVTVHNQSKPTTIKLSIEDDDGYDNSKQLTLSSNETKLITLHLDDLAVNKNYRFIAEGVSGIIFKNSSLLNVESKNCSLFIQTDKGLYKPGDSIKFRILVLDFKLRPISLGESQLKVFVTDAEKNRIKQWKETKLNGGVFSGELQLSEQPVLGVWTIGAEINEETKSATVEVAEYVLPKFDVQIDSAQHFNIKDGKVRAIIRSKYTYGKLVKGHAIVSVKSTSYYSWSGRRDAVVKTIKINGKGSVEFDISDDLKMQSDEFKRSATYSLSAVVVEELTGRNQTAIKEIFVHQTRYKIKAVGLETQFQQGLPVKLNIVVTTQDGKPVAVNEATKEIVISKLPNNKNLSETFTKHELSANGTTEVYIPTNKKDESGFTLRAKYLDEETEIGYMFPRDNSDPTNLEIKVLTKKPTLNKEVFVEVQSAEVLEYFTYQIISQGKLIHSNSLPVPQRKYHVFSFLATFDLLPEAHLIVYYFKDDAIISAKVDIDIREDLNNFVKLKLSETRVSPGEQVNIDISTNPKSFVGLLGVDQSVLLLKKNNDLSVDDAWSERELYKYQFHAKDLEAAKVNPTYFYHNYWGDFRTSRVILFTNAKQSSYPIIIREYERPVLFNKAGVAHAEAISYAAQLVLLDQNALAKPVAGLPSPSPKIRRDFPETWLWQSIDVDNVNGSFLLEKKVPDTITSWVISAFSIDPVTGLGLTKVPRTLEVFQPFFVSLNLPYSIKRGEILSVPVVVFNYLENDVNAEVIIHNDENEFTFVDANQTTEAEESLVRKKSIDITANDGASTSFLIKAKKIGTISIKVTITSTFAGDTVIQVLHVAPEGVLQLQNKALFVNLKDDSSLQSMLSADIPNDIVTDSLRVEVNCVGDLLGGTIKNLNQLIRLPSGCGEQNMLNFVPNIVILNYLKATGQSKPDVEKRAIKYTEKGYQRQLTYRHNDGSFSSFGKSDKSGSSWLTAFVAKSFRQATEYIDIDDDIIDEALKWLSEKQRKDGSFPEVGEVSHKDMQGGSSKGLALTAYVLTAFLENKESISTYEETINRAIDNIVNGLDEQENIYALAVAAYALQLANHANKEIVLNRLLEKSYTKDEKKWWSKFGPLAIRRKSSKTINVEITSYGLLALLENKQFSDGLPFFRWLLSQRNSKGGFEGTQDTVVGLQALAKFAEQISTKDNNVQLSVKPDHANETHFSINPENALVFQSFELPPSVRSINVTANGHGFALLQLSYRYHVNNSDAEPSFTLKPKVMPKTNAAHLNLEVCVSFEPKANIDNQSNMVVLEVSLPSGFVAESDALLSLSKTDNIKKVETKSGDTLIVVYFDYLKVNEVVCPVFDAFRVHKVAEQKPVSIVVYDYYDSAAGAREFYTIPVSTSCDVCYNDDCPITCK